MPDDPKKRDFRAEAAAIVAAKFGHGAGWPPVWVFDRLRDWDAAASGSIDRAARAPAPYRTWSHIRAYLIAHESLKAGGDGDLG